METNNNKQEVLLFTDTSFFNTRGRQYAERMKTVKQPAQMVQQFLQELLPEIFVDHAGSLMRTRQIVKARAYVGIDMGDRFDETESHIGIDPHVFLLTKELN